MFFLRVPLDLSPMPKSHPQMYMAEPKDNTFEKRKSPVAL
jgi:hypothetical protein